MMRLFTEWAFSEMGHIFVDDGEVMGKHVLDVDLRTEEYPNDAQHPHYTPLNHGNLIGRVPGENKYFVYIKDPVKGDHGQFVSHPPPGGTELPADWWDYAHVLFADGSQKLPTKGRPVV